ncbi:hypothetical protein NONO_c22510 [Nocardia nova SH22a]|uniref:DUF8020 domain-containing protein n=1 Tax=Nocardia nova SH22a TaxID=1415166 RepID=W5TCZ4_9NOCA|nr:hypothetical protein [Nocardia nova]AHH17049.1 hypothetical protein NONO_c22510 [Nocardia nova SH22a]
MTTFRAGTAIALLTVAATTTTCGIANADPTPPAIMAPAGQRGVEQGVGYDIARSGTSATVSLTNGTFRIGEDAVTIADGSGATIATLPLRLSVEDHALVLTPRTDATATTLIADVSAEDIGYWRKTSPRQRSIEAGMGIGALVGGLTGTFLGVVAGIATEGLLLPITLPVGLLGGVLAGMAVGGVAGAAIPNSDAQDQWDYQQECYDSGNYRYCW